MTAENELPKEFRDNIEQAKICTAQERRSNPAFKPTTSFLQRRLRWGFARASMVLPHIT